MITNANPAASMVATYPPNTAYLPGRSVTDAVRSATGVVTAVNADGTYGIKWDGGILEPHAEADTFVPVHPDLPALAHIEMYASALGEELARLAGPDTLAAFNDGWNNGRVAYTETARDLLRRLDQRALKAKHARCLYTYVVDPAGVRREDRAEFRDGDRLVTCTFFGDGPGSAVCGPHRPEIAGRSSIFYAHEDKYASGEAVALSPFETAGPARVEVAA